MLSDGRMKAPLRSTRRILPHGVKSRRICFRGRPWGEIGPLDPCIVDDCRSTLYTSYVIQSFRHRGLKTLYDGGPPAKVAPGHVAKLERILTALDRSSGPEGMDLPGFRLHPLKGSLKGHYAVSVSGNWRVTFRFEDGRAVNVDYLDYH